MQNDLLLEIEETADSLRELHEFRKQTLTRHTYEFKPVKDRPPTPLSRPNLREILRNADLTLSRNHHLKVRHHHRHLHPDTLHQVPAQANRRPPQRMSTTTTTVRHKWSDSDDSSTCSRQSNRDY